MRAWRILLPLGSSHKLLGGPGLGARAAIFWAPIWGRLKLFGPAFMEGFQFWVPLGDALVSVTKKKTSWDGRSAIWLLFSGSSSNDVLTRIYSLLGFIDKLQPLYVQLFFFFCFCSSCGDYYYLLLVKIRYDLEIYSVFQDLLYKIYITSAACLLTWYNYSDNFAGRVKSFLGPNPLVCFSADFFLFTEAILFNFE